MKEYFAPHAKKRWCVSLYGSGRQTSGVFPQVWSYLFYAWNNMSGVKLMILFLCCFGLLCRTCGTVRYAIGSLVVDLVCRLYLDNIVTNIVLLFFPQNSKTFICFNVTFLETTVEVLPRLCKIKYDSGTQEELLYVDMPREYQNASGQIVLDYAKAIQESVFDQLRVVRDGQLRIVFNSDLKVSRSQKWFLFTRLFSAPLSISIFLVYYFLQPWQICSWEFCARRHEELVPRRLIVPQVLQFLHGGQIRGGFASTCIFVSIIYFVFSPSQVTQLVGVAQKYQAATQNPTSTSNLSSQDLHTTCNS